ncbi:L,D-transpeptidase family protein [Stappia taiwanensis]|uniref:L,D-transpeptidase family protein n=1 Tax=Stappia taiwanensis TaxID=992267 RepID=A0A838XR25_9HYPH|nr:L,D-transpeptidase family protein [Stappia taiwanensis]MBA4611511.1 L,D-transpeptidase family protein [Stappia taiwanensis]GGE99680.1 hypothetical protein GCM10007285_29140 [Stappia taiwanensis]
MSIDLLAPDCTPSALPSAGPAEILRVRALSAHATTGRLSLGPITRPCALGRGGITRMKREGDGATPAGAFLLKTVYYRPDRLPRPRSRLPVVPLSPDMGWCDDPTHPRYNRMVTRPFPASHEVMWREDGLYDIVVVLDCNLAPAVRGRGSAIFFHLARPGLTPTEGCVALHRADMLKVLQACGPATRMIID